MGLVIKKNEIVNLGGYQTDMETLFRQVMPKETTLQEFGLFLAIAKSYELNPYKREIYPIKYGSSAMQIVCGYEVYLKRAERTGKLDGWKVEIAEDNKTATIIINRKDWTNPFSWTVEREEFDRSGEAKSDKNPWVRMPKFMLKKVAIGQGFRLAFPDEMGGLPYLQEELNAGMTMDMGNSNFIEIDENALPTATEKQTEKPKETKGDFDKEARFQKVKAEIDAITDVANLDAWVAKNVQKIGKSDLKDMINEYILARTSEIERKQESEPVETELDALGDGEQELELSDMRAIEA